MEGPSTYEEKKRMDDIYSQAELGKTIDAWRRKSHWRSEQFKRFKNIGIVGHKGVGKTAIINSYFKSLYSGLADKPSVIPSCDEPKCFRLTNRVFLWDIPGICDDCESFKKFIESADVPDFDVIAFVMNLCDLKEPQKLDRIKEMVEFVDSRKISSVFYVTKVDLEDPFKLSQLFDQLSRYLGVEKDQLYPVKNHTGEKTSPLIDYFMLRVLDKTLAAVQPE